MYDSINCIILCDLINPRSGNSTYEKKKNTNISNLLETPRRSNTLFLDLLHSFNITNAREWYDESINNITVLRSVILLHRTTARVRWVVEVRCIRSCPSVIAALLSCRFNIINIIIIINIATAAISTNERHQ